MREKYAIEDEVNSAQLRLEAGVATIRAVALARTIPRRENLARDVPFSLAMPQGGINIQAVGRAAFGGCDGH